MPPPKMAMESVSFSLSVSSPLSDMIAVVVVDADGGEVEDIILVDAKRVTGAKLKADFDSDAPPMAKPRLTPYTDINLILLLSSFFA